MTRLNVNISKLVVGTASGQIFPVANLFGLLVLHSFQLGAGCDPVAQTSTVTAASVLHLATPGEGVRLALQAGQEGRNLLLGLQQEVLQVSQDGQVDLVVDHGGGRPLVLPATCPSYPVHVVLDVVRHVVVDHMLDLRKIKTWTKERQK